ncbi:ICOS ligand-like [Leptodactylus fuscus]|uniref:ICOS ligand-like n=1 Tax=Leptodactylus fuscus TaxID=238119 RepID=UPI003F4E73AC
MKRYARLLALVFWCLTFVLRLGSGLVGKMHGSVELPCVCHQLPGPISEISVYWQMNVTPTPLLVAAVIDGKVNTTYVHETFRGRSQLNPDGLPEGKFNLTLSNLSLRDKGTYQCIIMWRPSSVTIINKTRVELEVKADFSTPVVVNPSSAEVPYGQEQNLTCTSQGGLEAPTILWINASDNREIQDGRVHQDVHHDGEVLSVSSTITLNITSKANILCVVVTKNGNVSSSAYNLGNKQDISQDVKSNTPVLIGCLITGGLLGIVLLVILVKCRHTRRTPEYGVPTNQMSELGKS